MNKLALIPLFLLAACADTEKPHEHNEGEVITTIVLDFAPTSGTATSYTWADPEADGSPVIDDITLADGETYAVSVSFLNELEDPPEDITEEVGAEDDQHQVFFTGSAVQGPATGDNAAAVVSHAYDDADENGFPVGLENTVASITPGSGTLTITLRHLPPENDVAVKTGTLAEDVAAGGIAALPGDTDVSVDFALTVE
ncbi:MAG: hypothetical protein FJ090_08545 [Deltaproteobacteria bacterium]|nr:hypothetical protein [Deltaproteobacteria bacterium]